MKTLLTKFDDFMDEVSSSQNFKRVLYTTENSVQPLEVKDAEGNIKPMEVENKEGKMEQIHKVVSIFRVSSAAYNEKDKEDWVGCNIFLANEMISGQENIGNLGTKIDAARTALLKRMKDKLVDNGIIIKEGMVTTEG